MSPSLATRGRLGIVVAEGAITVEENSSVGGHATRPCRLRGAERAARPLVQKMKTTPVGGGTREGRNGPPDRGRVTCPRMLSNRPPERVTSGSTFRRAQQRP
jgi:hypothetical protein